MRYGRLRGTRGFHDATGAGGIPDQSSVILRWVRSCWNQYLGGAWFPIQSSPVVRHHKIHIGRDPGCLGGRLGNFRERGRNRLRAVGVLLRRDLCSNLFCFRVKLMIGFYCVHTWASEWMGVTWGGARGGGKWKVPLPDATGPSCFVLSSVWTVRRPGSVLT